MSAKLKKGKHKILEAISLGANYAIASERGGISKSTLYNWIKKGKKDRAVDPYKTFVLELYEAESRGALLNLQVIQTAATKGDWRAASWILERRHNYKKELIQERMSERQKEEQSKTRPLLSHKEILREQADQTRGAMTSAQLSESWQAYAALSKHYLSILGEIRVIEAEEGALDKMDVLTDDQLIGEITNAIISLPPILRQRVQENLKSLSRSNVVSIRRK